MSFLGLMTVRAHEGVVKHWTHMFDTRGRVILDREATIGRLQRENARLLDELAHWKKHGQLRDPATGRLIPKPKTEELAS